MHAAVDVPVGPSVHVGHRLDDGLRLLSRRRVVKVDERVAVNLAGEDREAVAGASTSRGGRSPWRARDSGGRCSWARAPDRFGVAPGQPQTELRFHERAERRDADPRGDVAREGVDQELAGLRFSDPARAQVEHRGVVELPDRRAVPALDVVGEDLQRRLRVDQRFLRRSKFLFVCIASVFCAAGRTMILPLKTPATVRS